MVTTYYIRRWLTFFLEEMDKLPAGACDCKLVGTARTRHAICCLRCAVRCSWPTTLKLLHHGQAQGSALGYF